MALAGGSSRPNLTSYYGPLCGNPCSLRWAVDQTFQQKSTVRNLFTTVKLWENSDRKQFSTCFSRECLYEKLIPYFVSWSHLWNWVRPWRLWSIVGRCDMEGGSGLAVTSRGRALNV